MLESALVEVPTVVGWLRPVILLPASALTGLSPEQLEAILAHELAHIRRYDYLVNIVQTVVEILGFYHPAIWWVSRRIRIERENCCDDLAVHVCGSSLQYARALACMEEIRHNTGDLALAATGGSLMARIARLLGRPAVDDRRFAWLPGLVALLLVAGLIIPAALVLGTPDAAPVPLSAKDAANVAATDMTTVARAASPILSRPIPSPGTPQAARPHPPSRQHKSSWTSGSPGPSRFAARPRTTPTDGPGLGRPVAARTCPAGARPRARHDAGRGLQEVHRPAVALRAGLRGDDALAPLAQWYEYARLPAGIGARR